MRQHKLFLLVCLSGAFCLNLPAEAIEIPKLDLWVTGPAQAQPGDIIEVTTHRANTQYGLAGLSYDLEFSIPLNELTRVYSAYGWIANEANPAFDYCDPLEGDPAGIYDKIEFSTLADPFPSEFQPGEGIIEVITLTIPGDAVVDSWVTFDLIFKDASDAFGYSWLDLAGAEGINVLPSPEPEVAPLAYGVKIVPEPATLSLLAFGWGLARLRRKRCN
jgi:catechol 2,3-dioxygenase-like lactoylglutathione lyase family enzyme